METRAQESDFHTVFINSNFADIDIDKGVITAFTELTSHCESPWTWILNGDLLSDRVNFASATAQLGALVRAVADPDKGDIIVVPGDRDWDRNGNVGLEKVNLLQDFFKKSQFPNTYFPIQRGCPGPVLLPVNENLAVLTLSTQWINHPFTKPSSESAECDLATEESILEQVEEFIDDQSDKNILIVGHHPVLSNGEYGGSFPVHRWLFPLPGITAFQTSYHKNVGGVLDLANERLQPFLEQLRGLLSDQFSLIYAAGHEKNLEILKDFENIYLNSGALKKGSFVARKKNTLFRSRLPGTIALRYFSNGMVDAVIFQFDQNRFTASDTILLFQAPCLEPLSEPTVNKRLVPCIAEGIPNYVEPLAKPSAISITANPNYTASKSKARWLGQHYRDSWTKRITAPVLDLDRFAGGLVPLEIGGGRQTLSLKFSAPQNAQFVFRSVDKDPSKALARDLRSTIVSLLIRDQTTTQQPYGALAASFLLDRLDILHAHPQLFVMPNDGRLGPFLSTYGGMLGLMEERPVDPQGGHSFADADDIKRSLNLFKSMYKDRDVSIDQEDFVRARLFDVWVGDWGKHEDNWKWAGYKKGNEFRYRPIPRDRDHVFSRWDGILPWLADRAWAKPSGENFDYQIKGLRSLMWQARHLDRFVASEADKSDWLQAAAFIQKQIDEEYIDSAVYQMPPEVAKADGQVIAQKLKTRIKDLDKYAERYYATLAKEVDVVGSNKHEQFIVDRLPNGNVDVSMFKLKDGGQDVRYYHRLFNYQDTREIRLFGLDGNDSFAISGEAEESILIRLIPGNGRDAISDFSKVKSGKKRTLLYDRNQTDYIAKGSAIKRVKHASLDAYQYDRTAFKYNTYFPLVYLSYSSDYGISLNGLVNFTNYQYGKDPFAASHNVGASISSIGNIKLSYDGIWTKSLNPFDLIAGATIEKRKRYRYFIGLGNETTYEKDLLLNDYYTLQYTTVLAYLGVQNNFWKRSYLKSYFQLEYNSRQTLTDNIISDQIILGTDALKIGKLIFDLNLDFRDRENLPLQGTRFFITQQISQVATEELKTYFVGHAGLEYFMTITPFTLGVRSGALYSRNDVPYYDRPSLGQNQFLRGFRRNRFTGDGALYLNADLRIQISDKTASLVPHKYGVRLFCDQGKVIYKPAPSKVWHRGFGFGGYFTPFRERFTLDLSVAMSKEEKGLILFGFGSNF